MAAARVDAARDAWSVNATNTRRVNPAIAGQIPPIPPNGWIDGLRRGAHPSITIQIGSPYMRTFIATAAALACLVLPRPAAGQG
jgi:hypothetical protein